MLCLLPLRGPPPERSLNARPMRLGDASIVLCIAMAQAQQASGKSKHGPLEKFRTVQAYWRPEGPRCQSLLYLTRRGPVQDYLHIPSLVLVFINSLIFLLTDQVLTFPITTFNTV